MIFRLLAGILLFSFSAEAAEIRPYKDQLFAYPGIIESRDAGAYLVVDYNEMRDINGRDAVPERRAERRYLDTGVRRQQGDLSLKTNLGTIRHFAVGKQAGARFMVLYLHGQGGSRKQGADDFTFGGNFNRLKNLATRNGGLYLVPDFTDFADRGAAEVMALVGHYAARSPQAPVIIACGSMGGALCWRLAREADLVTRLGGLVLLGSMWDDGFDHTPAFTANVPVMLAHGSRDPVFPVSQVEKFYKRLKARRHPVRMVRFETGNHGTPIRMIDWRDTLNWMLGGG
ncbi:prolyl oligopeptidase family serine peptidase [Nitratireductor sp. CH_MIT9313-5]|jgi:pimeloyl-ACP methyl ester carboxylesterase|uniref:prolyl oligopeptidase family serine peptidase n=1 Tax=Nitratireductor sp. CH_MIT9313-5 TaxID=3107764 RepID=UPI003009A55D